MLDDSLIERMRQDSRGLIFSGHRANSSKSSTILDKNSNYCYTEWAL